MILKFEIPAVPPSNNKFIGRNQKWQYQEEKKKWTEAIAIFCRPKPSEPLKKADVILTYHFKDGRRRDPDNYSGKFILDGLVRCGILADDSFDVIDLHLHQGDISKKPYTEIEVAEKGDKDFYYQAELTDVRNNRSVLICRLEEIEKIKERRK